ncbi:hypothetical protein KC678_04130 [Candidatus Dojkabacteria bacterium]|uniref:EF-hand domain-containing protein n=1 Tax=Candidatus Dojkabacteria bacterium TaxID=2099670 RepID=A0A955L1Y4_9BACT|nr:hypothetical protein [Candidatus Dojkabacteria bacterium]
MESMQMDNTSSKGSKKDLRMILVIWIIVALFAVVFGGKQYFENRPGDVSVGSTTVYCDGACLGFGLDKYAVGTACLGDPTVVPGSDSTCYVCGADGNFTETTRNSCSHCYAQCLGDPFVTQYNNGDQCYNGGSGYPYGVYTCDNGQWVRGEQNKCAGQCAGDGAYTLYDKGHLCAVDNVCYECTTPGAEELGGFSVVDNAKCDAVATGGASCRAKCVGDTAEREYSDGSQCNAGTTAEGNYGTYTCNNGTWEVATTPKCVNQAPGDRPGTLYDVGFAFEWVGSCYQCVDPSAEYLGGFAAVDSAVCAAQGSLNPGHSQVGVCLGDLDVSGKVDLNDFAAFAKNFGVQLVDTWYYDLTTDGGSYLLTIEDFAIFAKNFDKDGSTCIKREVELPRP